MDKQRLMEALYGDSANWPCPAPSDRSLNKALATLYPREVFVLWLRFADPPMSRDRIASICPRVGKGVGVTTERIRQIEVRALRKLRHPTRTAWLKEVRPTPSRKAPRRLITQEFAMPHCCYFKDANTGRLYQLTGSLEVYGDILQDCFEEINPKTMRALPTRPLSDGVVTPAPESPNVD